jgi:hypothetical protein
MITGFEQVRLVETAERKDAFGHPWKDCGIQLARGDYLGITNDDNYYAPVYFEALLHVLTVQNVDLAYCDFVHSHKQWRFFEASPKKSKIDLGAWLVRSSAAKSTPWRDFGFAGDGTFVEDMMAKGLRAAKVPACLFVHN